MPNFNLTHRNMFISLVVVAFVSLGCILPFVLVNQCNELENVPDVSVYPNSTVSDQVMREFDRHQRATLTYIVNAERDDIIAFFEERLTCTLSEDGQTSVCQSRLENGNGDYFVYIPQSDSEIITTSYSVEIRWQGCNLDFEISE